MIKKYKTTFLIVLMISFMPSVFAQGFWKKLGRAVVSVASGVAENYIGATLNDKDRQAWDEISNDINDALRLDNNYVNAGNKIQEGKNKDAFVEMGVAAVTNSGNRTLITISNTVKAQNEYVNNVSSGMDQKTAQDIAAKQISEILLDDMEERERAAYERRKEINPTSKNLDYNAPNQMGHHVTEGEEFNSPKSAQHSQESYKNYEQSHLAFKTDKSTGIFYKFHGIIHDEAVTPKTGDLVGIHFCLRTENLLLTPWTSYEMAMDSIDKNDIFSAIRMMHIGDSATFIFNGHDFFNQLMDVEYPLGDEPLYLDIKLYGHMTKMEFEKAKLMRKEYDFSSE